MRNAYLKAKIDFPNEHKSNHNDDEYENPRVKIYEKDNNAQEFIFQW